MSNVPISLLLAHLDNKRIPYDFTGSMEVLLSGVASFDEFKMETVAFYRNFEFDSHLNLSNESNLLVLHSEFDRKLLPKGNHIFTRNPEIVFYHIGSFFLDKKKPLVHKKAVVSKSAIIGLNVSIGAFTYIGENVVIDDNVLIGQSCVIKNAKIGKGSVIHPGAKIGSDAMGPRKDEDGKWHDRPHFCIVKIGSDVRIEDNVVIQRGYLKDTMISKNVRIGTGTWIGNGVNIKEGALLAQQVTVAGSVSIGKNAKIWGKASLRDGIIIEDECVVGMSSVVLRNIPKSEIWVGNPAKFFKKKSK